MVNVFVVLGCEGSGLCILFMGGGGGGGDFSTRPLRSLLAQSTGNVIGWNDQCSCVAT